MTLTSAHVHCSDGAAVMRFNSPAASGSAAAFSLSVFMILVLSVLGVSSFVLGCGDSCMGEAPVFLVFEDRLRAGSA